MDVLAGLYEEFQSAQSVVLRYHKGRRFVLHVVHQDGRREAVVITRTFLDTFSRRRKTGVGASPKMPISPSTTPTRSSPLPPAYDATEDDDVAVMYQKLLEEYPMLSEAHRRVNVKGDVQSGKSRLMMAVLWCMMYVWDMDPVLVLCNKVDSYNQVLLRDVVEFNHWLGLQGIRHSLLFIHGLRGRASAKASVTKDKRRGTKSRSITLCMGNAAQLRKIVRRPNLGVVCDEADAMVKAFCVENDESKSGKLFHELVTRSKSTWMVTATPFALLNQKNVWSLSVVLPTKPTYRGLEQMSIHALSEETSKELKKDDAAMASFIVGALGICSDANGINAKGSLPYGALLVNARYTCKQQEELARSLALNHGLESYVVNSESPCYIKHYDAEGNVHHTGFARVADLFDEFERCANVESVVDSVVDSVPVYRSYVLIANRTANRAVSFRPNPSVGKGGLIGEILLPSDDTHCASLLQMNRLAGNYDPEYPPLHLFVSEKTLGRMELETLNISHWVSANAGGGFSREQMEGTKCYLTGGHDRAAVDDTVNTERHKVIKEDYGTKEELLNFLKSRYTVVHTMTEDSVQSVAMPEGFEFGLAMGQQGRIREEVKRCLGVPPEKHLVMTWKEREVDPRWEEMHNMRTRFGTDTRWKREFTASPTDDGALVNVVRWKEGYFCEDPADPGFRVEDLCENDAYIYLTTANTWRFFNSKEKRMVGILGHAC